jgi:hypothetical protein
VSGTIHGQSFHIVDAVSMAATLSVTGGTQMQGLIFLTTTPHYCGDLAANTVRKGEMAVSISLADITGQAVGAPTMAGTYTVAAGGPLSPKAAAIKVVVTDQSCMAIAPSGAKATAGAVKLTSVDANAFDGTFDVTLDSGDHVSGSFSPESCPAIQTAIDSTTPASCM